MGTVQFETLLPFCAYTNACTLQACLLQIRGRVIYGMPGLRGACAKTIQKVE